MAAEEQHNGAVTAAAVERLAAAATAADRIAAQQVAAPSMAAAKQAAVEQRSASLAEIRSDELMAWDRSQFTPECKMQAVAQAMELAATQRAADELAEEVRV